MADGEIFRLWAAGLCPCCGGSLCEWIDGTEPYAVGEMVKFCGRCIAMDHQREPVAKAILAAIAMRSDEPVNRALGIRKSE